VEWKKKSNQVQVWQPSCGKSKKKKRGEGWLEYWVITSLAFIAHSMVVGGQYTLYSQGISCC
jgi:hypothetical protein